MVWIVCDDAVCNDFKKVHTINCSLRKKSKFCKQCGKLDYSGYSEVSLLTLYYHWLTLSISFLLEKVIAKYHKLSLSAMLYVLSYSSLSFDFMF